MGLIAVERFEVNSLLFKATPDLGGYELFDVVRFVRHIK